MRFLFLLLSLVTIKCFANQDTVYTYFDSKRNVSNSAKATYISKTAKENNCWHKQVFIISSGSLYIDGYYADERTTVPNGTVKHIGENQQTSDSLFFLNGKLKSKYSFYNSGTIKNYIVFADSSLVSEQGGYNEDGKVISNYIVWRPAMYPKNMQGWQKYLKRKFRQKVPGGYQKGMMSGKAVIQFTIDTTGNVTDASIAQTSGFIDLDQRALSAIQESPKWIPAIIDNHLTESVEHQPVTFVNSEASIFNFDSFDIAYNVGYIIGNFLR